MGTKLGFSDRKTTAPESMAELLKFLSTLMSATVNNEVDLDTARTASNIADRIIQGIQADTRMKAVAIATGRQVSQSSGYTLIEENKKIPPLESEAA